MGCGEVCGFAGTCEAQDLLGGASTDTRGGCRLSARSPYVYIVLELYLSCPYAITRCSGLASTGDDLNCIGRGIVHTHSVLLVVDPRVMLTHNISYDLLSQRAAYRCFHAKHAEKLDEAGSQAANG